MSVRILQAAPRSLQIVPNQMMASRRQLDQPLHCFPLRPSGHPVPERFPCLVRLKEPPLIKQVYPFFEIRIGDFNEFEAAGFSAEDSD